MKGVGLCGRVLTVNRRDGRGLLGEGLAPDQAGVARFKIDGFKVEGMPGHGGAANSGFLRFSVRTLVRTSAVRTGVLLETVWKHQPWKPAFACQHPVRFCQWRFCCQPAWQLRRWQPAFGW